MQRSLVALPAKSLRSTYVPSANLANLHCPTGAPTAALIRRNSSQKPFAVFDDNCLQATLELFRMMLILLTELRRLRDSDPVIVLYLT